MVQIVNESNTQGPSLWEKYRTIKSTARVETLRQRYLNIPNKVVRTQIIET